MAARTPEDATDTLLARLRAVVSCVTDQPLAVRRKPDFPGPLTISFLPFDSSVVLRSEDRRRTLRLFIDVMLSVAEHSPGSRDFVASTRAYNIALLDGSGREIIAWHWHPVGLSPITHTHLHLSSQVQPIPLERGPEPLPLADLHIPTGFVDLADIVRFLIGEVGIQPRKRDWRAVLDALQ